MAAFKAAVTGSFFGFCKYCFENMILCLEAGDALLFFKKPAYLLRVAAAATTTTRCQETKPWLCAGGCCFEFSWNQFWLWFFPTIFRAKNGLRVCLHRRPNSYWLKLVKNRPLLRYPLAQKRIRSNFSSTEASAKYVAIRNGANQFCFLFTKGNEWWFKDWKHAFDYSTHQYLICLIEPLKKYLVSLLLTQCWKSSGGNQLRKKPKSRKKTLKCDRRLCGLFGLSGASKVTWE